MSETKVRHEHDGFVLITNLIIHHGIADIFNQTTKDICILDVVQETFHPRLFFQWLEFSEDYFQFPNNPFPSDSALNHGRGKLTVPVPSSSVLHWHRLQKLARIVRRRVP
jgi:hypothetical protein